MTVRCESCGGELVECPFDDHQPWSLCRGWRHVPPDADRVVHIGGRAFGKTEMLLPLQCPGSDGGADGETFRVARPATDQSIMFARAVPDLDLTSDGHRPSRPGPAYVVLVVALSLIVVAVILDAVFGWWD